MRNAVAECTLCDGTGYQIVERGGYSGAATCECRKPLIREALVERAGIP